MNTLNDLIKEFCRKQKMDDLTANADGEYQIVFDDEHQIFIFERFKQLHLMKPIESADDECVRKQVMAHAFAKIKDSPCTPAILGDGRFVLLSSFPIVDMDLDLFEETIEAFVNTLDGFSYVLRQPSHRGTATPQMILRP